MLADSDFRVPTLDPIDDPVLRERNIDLRMLRLDRIHPQISGNKWYKLKLNLLAAQSQAAHTILSFGGAYSNHLVALAAASKLSGLRSIGVIRGEAPKVLNPALRFAQQQGMTLHFVSRSDYRNKEDPEFIELLEQRFGNFYLIPEGGSNLLGIKGCAEIADHLRWQRKDSPHLVLMACGTAATLTGVVSAGECLAARAGLHSRSALVYQYAVSPWRLWQDQSCLERFHDGLRGAHRHCARACLYWENDVGSLQDDRIGRDRGWV